MAKQVDVARAIAQRAHRGQTDKAGEPYIQHPARVAELVQLLPEIVESDEQFREDAVAAAWLHDVIEDTEETAASLRSAGIRDRAVEAVLALTRRDDVAPDDYYAAIAAQPLARLVKVADIASNLEPIRVHRLDPATRDRLASKYAHALQQLGVARSVIDQLHRQIGDPLVGAAAGDGEVVAAVAVPRRVVLCDRRDQRGRYYEEAAIDSAGHVHVTGEDSGSSVEEFFGPDLRNYAWHFDVPADRVPALLAALGGSPGDDVLTLLQHYYESHERSELTRLLRTPPVNADFDSYNN